MPAPTYQNGTEHKAEPGGKSRQGCPIGYGEKVRKL